MKIVSFSHGSHRSQQLTINVGLVERVSNRLRSLWYDERIYFLSFVILSDALAASAKDGKRLSATDIDLMISHLAIAISAEMNIHTEGPVSTHYSMIDYPEV